MFVILSTIMKLFKVFIYAYHWPINQSIPKPKHTIIRYVCTHAKSNNEIEPSDRLKPFYQKLS